MNTNYNIITVGVMPTFFCKKNCPYCYLSEKDRNDTTVCSIIDIAKRLTEIYQHQQLMEITCFGGDLETLSNEYLNDLFFVLKSFSSVVSIQLDSINYRVINLAKKYSIKWAISYNPERKSYKKLKFILPNTKCSVITVLTPDLIKHSAKDILQSYLNDEKYTEILSVSFLQYSPSICNKLAPLNNFLFEQKLIEITNEYINHRDQYTFVIENIEQVKSSINKHIYDECFILPSGKFGYISFKEDKEYGSLEEFMSFDTYIEIKEKQTKSIIANTECLNCMYLNCCYADHIRQHLNNDACSGRILFKKYIDNLGL